MKKTIAALLSGTYVLLAGTVMAVSACPDILAPVVRELNLATKGELGMMMVSSETEARAAFGDDIARKLSKMVDFTREKVVRISFETPGPPDDHLRHNVDGKNVKFTIVSPGGLRGMRLGIVVHLFAVPADAKITLNGVGFNLPGPAFPPDPDTDLPGREREEFYGFIQDTRRLLVLEPLHTWSGKFLNANDGPLMKAAPKSGFIANDKAWTELFKAWNLSKDRPKIDFTKQLVLVDVAQGSPNTFFPNMITLNVLRGDLRAGAAVTEIAGPGFIYLIRVVDRTGVKTVNGTTLDKE
jgi:hypothetical protein